MAHMLAMLLLATLSASPAEGRVVERIVAVVRNPARAGSKPEGSLSRNARCGAL